MILLFSLLGSAEAEDIITLNADLKSFFLASDPIDHIFYPEGAYGQGYLDGRVKLRVDFSDSIRLEAHHALTAGTSAPKTQRAVAVHT